MRHRHSVVHLAHFLVRAQESGRLESLASIDLDTVKKLLHERIDQVDFEQAKADVMPSIKGAGGLELWSTGYFHDLTEQLLGTD